jgi:hypothetical protein
MRDSRYGYERDSSAPFVIDDGGGTKLIALIFIMFAVFVLLYMLTHSIEWSAAIMLAAIALPCIVYLVMWWRVKEHRMKCDVMALHMQMPQAPRSEVPFSAVPALPSGQTGRTNWATGFDPSPALVTDFDRAGNRMDISYPALQHFIESQFPKPNRDSRWRMQAEDYGHVAYFLSQIKNAPLVNDGRGFKWAPGVTQEMMRDWVDALSHESREDEE